MDEHPLLAQARVRVRRWFPNRNAIPLSGGFQLVGDTPRIYHDDVEIAMKTV